jgi:hypothetical protein
MLIIVASMLSKLVMLTIVSHLSSQIRTQEVYMKKIISGIRYFFQVFLR